MGSLVSAITMRQQSFYSLNYCIASNEKKYDEQKSMDMQPEVYEGKFSMYDRNLHESFLKYNVGGERYNE